MVKIIKRMQYLNILMKKLFNDDRNDKLTDEDIEAHPLNLIYVDDS